MPVELLGNGSGAGGSVADGERESVRGHWFVLRRLFCFFGIIAMLAFVTDTLITTGLRRIRTSSYGAWNQAMQGEVNADVIISGSSRAAYHYDPRVIEATTGHSAFNLGRAGSQTDVQLAVLKAYLEHNRKPDLIVHNLDAFTFVTSREVFDPGLYVPYLHDPELYRPLRQISPDIAKSRYIPLYGYVVQDMSFTWVLGLKQLAGSSPRQDYFSGFTPRDLKWTDDFQKFKGGASGGAKFAVEPKGEQILEELMKTCKEKGIPLVLVYSPEYSEMQALETNRAEIFGEFKRLADQYSVPIWDYSDWKYAHDTDYFYNSQHLNARGAEQFSQDLASRLKEYMATRPALAGSSRQTSSLATSHQPGENQ